MEKQTRNMPQKKNGIILQSYFRPITQDYEDESCEFCTYCDQDIDTFPCAKCHTRH